MPRKKKDIHYIYRTTCNVTNRYYIGIHSTIKLDDGYMGSGKRLRYSIRKYGEENHTKEILEFYDTRELLVEAEKSAITPEMLTDNNCMNIVEGGGGFTTEYAKICAAKSNEKQKVLRQDPKWVEKKSKAITESQLKAYAEGRKVPTMPDWTGKKHSKETKEKMSESSKGKGKGYDNSQYGTCWITNGKKK